MSPNAIRAALKFRGIKITDLAECHSISHPVLHRAISRRARSKRAEQIIAQAIGQERLTVFGPNQWELRRLNREAEASKSCR